METNLKIEIRPIPNRGNIGKYSKDLEYFSQPHTVGPDINAKTLHFVTGLEEKDLEYLKNKECPYDLSSVFKNGTAHPFWESVLAKTSLLPTPMFLYPYNSILDFIKWKYLQKSSFVYASEQEMREGVKPQATHFLYNEEEENSVKASILERRNSLVGKVSGLSLQRKRDIILILKDEDTTNKNENYLTVVFDQIISDKDLSQRLEEILNKHTEAITLLAEVKLAIQRNVLKRTKKGIFYFESNLGFGEEDVSEFLSNPENQQIYLNIKSKLK